MQAEDFIYPPYGIQLLEAYGGLFESVFIVLHPFVRIPEALSWGMIHHYPDDAQIVELGTKCTWAEVAAQTGMTSCSQVNRALLTLIGSLTDDFADWSGRDALRTLVQTQPVWIPAEGHFEPLLQSDFLELFATAGAEELIFVPEFPCAESIVRLPVDGLKCRSVPFPSCGTLLAPDASFLITVDWDSFFTLFYGSHAFVAHAVRSMNLESFFATSNTEHAWFNYSLGCATITVSPEDWQTSPLAVK